MAEMFVIWTSDINLSETNGFFHGAILADVKEK
jgi:hypothetical protein